MPGYIEFIEAAKRARLRQTIPGEGKNMKTAQGTMRE